MIHDKWCEQRKRGEPECGCEFRADKARIEQLEAENERLREKRDFWKRRADSRQDHIDALRKEIMENAKEGTDETT